MLGSNLTSNQVIFQAKYIVFLVEHFLGLIYDFVCLSVTWSCQDF